MDTDSIVVKCGGVVLHVVVCGVVLVVSCVVVLFLSCRVLCCSCCVFVCVTCFSSHRDTDVAEGVRKQTPRPGLIGVVSRDDGVGRVLTLKKTAPALSALCRVTTGSAAC